MTDWQQSLDNSIGSAEELAKRFGIDPVPLAAVTNRYPLRITPHYLSLISEPGDPIWRQCVPDPLEIADDGQIPDPLDEGRLSPVPGVIHRYPDRAVLVVSNICAVYCRFCMRKRTVGCHADGNSQFSLDAAVDYLQRTPSIHDVILSGGDPLLLPDGRLEEILVRLRTIPHLDIIRIGSRVPVTLPERITPDLCRMLKRFHPVYLNTHFNHPLEVTPESAAACALLADAGIPLGNQTVLLKGVNDEPAVMRELMRRLLAIRVRPYYIHQMDLVRGTAHFRTPISAGLAVMDGLRGHISGLATPYYVIDLPGGKGKVPLLPDYVSRRGDLVLARNYLGEVVEYKDLPD